MTVIDPRVQVRLPGKLAAWLAERTAMMHTGSHHVQAKTEIGLWRDTLALELRRIRLTLAQASCIADVLNGHLISPGIASSIGIVYAECYDAFQIARDVPPGLNPDVSSYGAKWGPEGSDPKQWEQDLLGYLGKLGPAADHALLCAIARWWEQDEELAAEGFAKAGLRVADTP